MRSNIKNSAPNETHRSTLTQTPRNCNQTCLGIGHGHGCQLCLWLCSVRVKRNGKRNADANPDSKYTAGPSVAKRVRVCTLKAPSHQASTVFWVSVMPASSVHTQVLLLMDNTGDVATYEHCRYPAPALGVNRPFRCHFWALELTPAPTLTPIECDGAEPGTDARCATGDVQCPRSRSAPPFHRSAESAAGCSASGPAALCARQGRSSAPRPRGSAQLLSFSDNRDDAGRVTNLGQPALSRAAQNRLGRLSASRPRCHPCCSTQLLSCKDNKGASSVTHLGLSALSRAAQKQKRQESFIL